MVRGTERMPDLRLNLRSLFLASVQSAPAEDAVVTKPKLAPAAMAGGMRIQQR